MRSWLKWVYVGSVFTFGLASATSGVQGQILGARWHYATPRTHSPVRRPWTVPAGHHDPEGVPGYPRYTGAFHARYFENYGIPSGDIGPRGNGIFVTPW